MISLVTCDDESCLDGGMDYHYLNHGRSHVQALCIFVTGEMYQYVLLQEFWKHFPVCNELLLQKKIQTCY